MTTITKPSYLYPLSIIGILFFVFGFLTWINGILIPYFQICMELSNFQATLVAFSAYFAYFVMALPAAWVLNKTGYRIGMVYGLCVMALGTLMFIPAAYSRLYPIFLIGLFITATGLALVQTAANPYIAIMGPIESTAQRIGFMGLANKGAGIICLLILGNFFLADADGLMESISGIGEASKSLMLDAYALKIVKPYMVISLVLLMVALLIYFSKLPEIDASKKEDQILEGNQERDSVLQYPYLILGVIALFMAGACETIPIDGIIIYSRSLGIPMDTARHLSTYTLYVMIFGYIFVSVLVPKYISQRTALLIAAIWGLIFTIGVFTTSGMYSIYCMLALGFSASMLWGTIWGLSLRGLGKHTKKASALLIMSLIGGGILPVIYGKLLDNYTNYPQTAILVLLPCYFIILGFGLRGYRIEKWN